MRGGLIGRLMALFVLCIAALLLPDSAVSSFLSKKNPSIPFVKTRGGFVATTYIGSVVVDRDGLITYLLHTRDGKPMMFTEQLNGARALAEAGEPSKTRVLYLKPSTDRFVRMKAYNGVSVSETQNALFELRARMWNIEKFFVVKPFSSPDRIRVSIHRAHLSLGKDGRLKVSTDAGSIYFSKPVAYQIIDGRKVFVDVSYKLYGDSYGFRVGEYEPSKPLVIDPLLASTFFGGQAELTVEKILVDKNTGNVYVAGNVVGGFYEDYTVTFGYPFFSPYINVFSNDLSQLLIAAFIGPGGDLNDIALDSQGNIYMVGYDTYGDLINTEGAYQDSFLKYTVYGCGSIVKFKANFTGIVRSTYLCGDKKDSWASIKRIALDNYGNVYVAGVVSGDGFPTTSDAYDRDFNGPDCYGGLICTDVFVSKLSSDLSTLLASTYLGGSDEDMVNVLRVLGSYVYVGGKTCSEDFPTTSSALSRNCNNGNIGCSDGFVTILDSNLSTLIASTYIGGSGYDWVNDIGFTPLGSMYVAGMTTSDDIQKVPGGYEYTLPPYNGADFQGFLMQVSSSLKYVFCFTYFDREIKGIAIGSDSSIYATGTTYTPINVNMIGALMYSGKRDIFVVRFTEPLYSVLDFTYLGGSDEESSPHIALDSQNNVFIAGRTYSPDFPVTDGSYNVNTYYSTTFVSKFDPDLAFTIAPLNPIVKPLVPYIPLSPAPFNPIPVNVVPHIDSFTANPQQGDAPLNVTFKCLAHDQDGEIVQYRWDFDGDGSVDNITYTPEAHHTYAEGGTFTAWCIVVDNASAFVKDNLTITVRAAQTPSGSDNSTGGIGFHMAGVSVTQNAVIAMDANGSVAAGTPNGSILVLDPGLNSVSDNISATGDIRSIVYGYDSSIYFTTSNSIEKFDKTKSSVWRFVTTGGVHSVPAIGTDGSVYIADDAGYLYGLNPDGSLKFKKRLNGAVTSSSVALDARRLYVADTQGNVYCFDLDGSLLWEETLGDSFNSSPAITMDGVYFAGESGKIYKFDVDGHKIAEFMLPGAVDGSSPVIASDGTMYIGSTDGYLYAMDSKGSILWKFDSSGKIYSTPAIARDGSVYFGNQDGYVFGLNADGTLRFKLKLPSGVRSSPIISDNGTVYINTEGGEIVAIFVENGGAARGIWPRFHHDNFNRGNILPFADVDKGNLLSWATDDIVKIYNAFITNGYPDGTYKPDNSVKRSEMAAFITRALGLTIPTCANKPFSDVDTGTWYCGYVKALKDAGIVKGYPDGTYRPDDVVTRAQMAVFISRAFLGSN